MTIRLGENNYGKQSVRVLRVARQESLHEIQELTLGIRFEGDFEAAHAQGDNRKVLPTDTMKNTVYALARQHPLESAEKFCLQLAEHFLSRNPQVSKVGVDAAEVLWLRLAVGEKPHAHTFTRAGGEQRTVSVAATRSGKTLRAGLRELTVLKTAQSAFEQFLRDEYTTLKEDRNRIFSTVISAEWLYEAEQLKFDSVWKGVRESLLKTFAEHESLSVQQTLYAMGEAVLEQFEAVREIHLSLPNKHYNLVDLSPFHMENPGMIFLPTDAPHGLIEATLRKD